MWGPQTIERAGKAKKTMACHGQDCVARHVAMVQNLRYLWDASFFIQFLGSSFFPLPGGRFVEIGKRDVWTVEEVGFVELVSNA